MESYAESGNIDAINRLGYMYFRGLSLKKDLNTARSWYEKGAELGDTNSLKKIKEIDSQIFKSI